MKIGIVIAIARELKSFLESSFEIETLQTCGREVYKTEVNGNQVYAVKSGYGPVDAAAATEFLLVRYECDVILNYGVTGALKEHMKVDDLFVITKTVNCDYDVSPIDPVKPCQYEEFPDEFMPLSEELIAFAKTIRGDLHEAVAASGEKFIDKTEDKLRLRAMGCDVCDMEIAAITRVCFLHRKPVLSVKCISDTFEGDGGDFNTNVRKSSDKAFALFEEILWSLK